MSQHVTWESHSNHILTVITVFIHYPLTMWLTCITPVSYCMFLAYTKSSPIIYVLYHVPNLTHAKSHELFCLHVLSHVSPGHMLCSIQCIKLHGNPTYIPLIFLYCAISFNSSPGVTCDQLYKNFVSSPLEMDCDLTKKFVEGTTFWLEFLEF